MSNTDFDPSYVPDPTNVIQMSQRAALGNVATSVEDDPDKAARAIDLSNATGTPPSVVYGDLEHHELQLKAKLSSDLIANNPQLQDYVNSHPLAAKVSNDDYGQLDAVSQAVNKQSGVGSVLQAISKGFKENANLDQLGGEYDKLSQALASNPVFANIFVRQAALAGATTLEGSMALASGVIGGVAAGTGELYKQMGGNEAQAARLTRDLIVAAQVGLSGQAGLHGIVHPEVAAMVGEAARVAKVVEPYIQAGKEIPTGASWVTDQFKVEQAGRDADNLKEALKESIASSTRERSPELFANFIRQHTDADIGISADAVRELYGDKVPSSDDGLLGFVPDLEAQLGRAEATGGDIQVSVADWLAKVEPDVAKKLEDHIRARPEGMTVEEGKNLPIIEAYHGSPHEFDAFSIDKIGTGEGAQSYGHGLYFAEHPEVAGQYAEKLSEGQQGQQYKVHIKANKEDFLDWDKPFSAQSPTVQETLRPILEESLARQQKARDEQLARGVDAFGRPYKADRLAKLQEPVSKIEDLTGEQIHKRIGLPAKDQHEGAQQSAKRLRELGIPGIKYLDEGSRNAQATLAKSSHPEDLIAPKPTHNLVVFSDKDIEIIEKNGEAVRSVRQAAGLQGIQERKLELKREETATTPGGDVHHFSMLDNATGRKGDLFVSEESVGKRLYVEDVQGELGPQTFGPGAMRDLLQQIKTEFPNAESLEGIRVSGAREKADLEAGKERPAKELKAKIDLTKIKPRLPKQLELDVTRQEDKEAFAKASAIGMTVDQYKRYQKLIEKRAAEDADAAQARALADQRRAQTAEWKSNRAELRPQVKSDIEARPDVELDEMLREGKVRLSKEGLTDDQLALLPKDYVSTDGIHPEDLAGLFGDSNPRALVDRLVALAQTRDAAGMKPKAFHERMIDAETDRQMEAKYGSLDRNILEEAKDQVLSETQEELLHEEVLALASQAGAEFSITKEELKGWVKEKVGGSPLRAISSDKFLGDAGRAGRAAELALLKGDYAEAFRQKQRQYLAFTSATEAKKIEKARVQFEKTAKRFSSREVAGVDQEYTNFIHDILGRVGQPVKRTVQDLQDAIARGEQKTLEDFVDFKQTHDMREVPIAEFLSDPKFKKAFEDLTGDEFKAVHDSVKALAKNGRDEQKIIKAGEEFDLNEKKREMIEQLQTFKEKHYDAVGGRWLGPIPPSPARPLRTYSVAHLQLESILNRWDHGDPYGVFTQFITRDLAAAANSESALEREFATKLRALADKVDLKERVPNELFKDPLGDSSIQMTRKNLRAILLNVGNKSNFEKLARGYITELGKGDEGKAQVAAFQSQIMDWLHQNATKEDWDWAQGIWDTFAGIKKQSDTMYRSLTGGVEPESIPFQKIQTPHGEYAGGYYPVIYHQVWEGASKKLMGGDALEQQNYVRATTPAGYTKQRTGYAAPLALDLDMMPVRMRQMLHDVAFRPAVIQAGKIFYDKDVRAAITQHYGSEYTKMLVPYLRDVANSANYRNDAQQVFTRFSETIRQNIIATLIGLNPGTVLKHGPTAAVNSITEVGLGNFLKAAKGLFSINEGTGETNWAFAMKTSEELQRRQRFYRETLGGATEEIQGETSLRDHIIALGATPVAMSDLLSATPTWMAKYTSEMAEHGVHGDAVFEADRAVRRAHGSSVITNRPQVMRTGPMGSWLASLYGFFNHIMNRQYELAWKAGDTLDMVKQGDYAKAMAEVPKISGMLFSYVIFPALVEELVTPLTTKDKESWGMKAAKSLGYSISASWIGIRDIVSAAVNGRDPSIGLLSTAYKTVTDTLRDLNKDKALSKRNAGMLIQHSATTLGAATGLMNAQVGKSSRFIYDYATGQEHPKGPWGWMTGLRYGTLKNHPPTFDQYMKGH